MDAKLDLSKCALVVIDVQKGIALQQGLEPYDSDTLIKNNNLIANKLLNTPALIVLVHVKNYGGEALHPICDKPNRKELLRIAPDPTFSDFLLDCAYDTQASNIIHVKKHNWGAFYGTDLDVQLRRRGIETIILTGIATTIGVDTTLREAYQHNYNVICIEDAMTDSDASYHKDTIEKTFKRISRVKTMQELFEMIES